MTDIAFERDKALTNAKLATIFSGIAVVLSVLAAFGSIWVFNSLTDTSVQDNMNTIGLSMAVLQTLLAVVALGGFWMFRNSAISKSAEVSEETTVKYCGSDEFSELVKRAVKAQIEGDSMPMINRIITEYIDTNGDNPPTLAGVDGDDGTLELRRGLENA